MSFLLKFVFIVCAVAVTARPLTEEEEQAMFKDVLTKCSAQVSATDFDLQEVMSNKLPSLHSGQCLRACLMDTYGFMKDGKFWIEGSLKMAEKTGDPAKVKNAKDVAKECESVVGADECETALKILQCTDAAAIARGLDLSKDLF